MKHLIHFFPLTSQQKYYYAQLNWLKKLLLHTYATTNIVQFRISYFLVHNARIFSSIVHQNFLRPGNVLIAKDMDTPLTSVLIKCCVYRISTIWLQMPIEESKYVDTESSAKLATDLEVDDLIFLPASDIKALNSHNYKEWLRPSTLVVSFAYLLLKYHENPMTDGAKRRFL